MARVTNTKTTTTKSTVTVIKPKTLPPGMVHCNICDGKGYHRKPKRGK